MIAGEGTVTDLSEGGCCVRSQAPMTPGAVLELRLHLPDQKSTAEIRLAAVRWKREGEFGIEFLQVRTDVLDRIRQSLKDADTEQKV